MRYFWGALLGMLLSSLVWMYVCAAAADRQRTRWLKRELTIRERLETSNTALERLRRNLCGGDKTLRVEELSYRCD